MSLIKQRNVLKMVIMSIGATVVSLAIMYIGEKISPDYPTWKALFAAFGSLVLGSVAISLIWEYFQKRDFTQELLEHFKLSESLHASGLKEITYRFDEVDWKLLFHQCDHFDMFVSYGRSWRATNEKRLEDLAALSGAKIRIILSDPSDPDVLKQFSVRYRKTEDEMRALIQESIDGFKGIFEGRPASFEIRVSSRPPTNTYYRFNNSILITLYNYKQSKGDIPVFLANRAGGRLVDFFEYEFEFLWSEARPV